MKKIKEAVAAQSTATIRMRIYKAKYDRWFDTPGQLRRYEIYHNLKERFKK